MSLLSTADARRRPSGRLGFAAILLALTAAVAAALLTGSGAGRVSGVVEAISATSATFLARMAAALPLGYAVGAGMVSAVNPCGFALLPTYLGIYLGTAETPERRPGLARRLLSAGHISALVTLSFVVLFGVAGVVLGLATSAIARYLPWVGLAIGVLLVLAGGRMLGGKALYISLGEQLADRLGGAARRSSSRGYFAYGLAYGSVSLSCTLPIFLTVVGSALTTQGILSAGLQFVLYALGMGLVITALTLATALLKHGIVARVRAVGRFAQPASAFLLLVAGAYIIYYWLTLGGLLSAVRPS